MWRQMLAEPSWTFGVLSRTARNEKIGKETKLSSLVNSKLPNKPAKYLNSLTSRKSRSLFGKLRLGTLDLEVEKSRQQNIPRAERFCKLCCSGEVEDVAHFILNCNNLVDTRKPFIDKLSIVNKSFCRFTPEAKINYLYFNENIPAPCLEIAANLLCCLKEKRDTIICGSQDVVS